MEKPNSNPSNIDQKLMEAIVITRPLYSYVLIGFIFTSIVAIIWGVFGSIAQKIEGIGEISTTKGLSRVTATFGGEITRIHAKLNDNISKGDVLFTIKSETMEFTIDQMELTLEQLKSKNALISSGTNKNELIKKRVDNLEKLRLKEKENELKKKQLFLEKRIVVEKEMYDKGLVTYSQYFSTQNKLSELKIEKIIIEEELILISLNNEKLNLDNDISEKNLTNQIIILEKKLVDIKKDYKTKTEVTAKKDGFLRQINVNVGDVVSSEITMGLISVREKNLENYILNLYIPFNSNEPVKKGMDVDIQLFNIDHNLYGWLKGNVKYVSEFAASREGLMRDLGNIGSVNLVTSKGMVYKVVVQLRTDPNTFNGFEWSNKKGPPLKIFPGQFGQAFVNVKSKAPIDFVLPVFDEIF